MRIVALEEHVGRFEMVGRVPAAAIAARGWPRPDRLPPQYAEFARLLCENAADRVQAMDRGGIDKQVVSVAGPGAELLPPGEKPVVQAYIDKHIWLVKKRLPQLAQGTAAWWLESRPFFGGLQRERIWVFWRRVLHTCHHRTQVQTWLRLAGHEPVPAIYGPSGDVKWDEADPTYSLEAAKRGG